MTLLKVLTIIQWLCFLIFFVKDWIESPNEAIKNGLLTIAITVSLVIVFVIIWFLGCLAEWSANDLLRQISSFMAA